MHLLKFVFSQSYVQNWLETVCEKTVSDLPLNVGAWHLKKEGEFIVGIIDRNTAFFTYCEAVADRKYYQINEPVPENPWILR